MTSLNRHKVVSAVFVTFSGNCRKALTHYQTCFGGTLQFETFEQELQDYTEKPVITGSLVSNRIIIYGSDLVHNEGRKLGNYLSILLLCKNVNERRGFVEKLGLDRRHYFVAHEENQQLVEVIDAFDVRWLLAI